jgi:glycosyltransferase involved in cell wall biosynthesis
LPTRRGSASAPKVAFVYPNSRRELAAEVAAGMAPDSTLLGQNHLAEVGVEAEIHDPALTRRKTGRLRWNLRELVLPWELQGYDAAFTPLAALFPLVSRRLPVVVVNYGLCTIWDRSSPARRRLLGASLRSAAHVFSLGEWQRDRLIEQAGLVPARTSTALLGIDERFFSPRPPDSAPEPYVLAVGKDLARDYATFVEALAPLGVRLELAVYPRNVERIELPPQARARVVGPQELRELYAGASCVVLPQRRQEHPYGSEGGGLTALLEALAMARPLVASDRPILRDYVADGETGLLVPPEDPAALREAVERVLGDEELARRLGAAGRARVEEALTTRHFAERIAPVLREAAG